MVGFAAKFVLSRERSTQNCVTCRVRLPSVYIPQMAEGRIEIGPSEKFFVFIDGGYLGQRLLGLLDHFQLPADREYTNLGCMRITVERLKEPA